MRFLILVVLLVSMVSSCGKNALKDSSRKSLLVLQLHSGYFVANPDIFNTTNPFCESAAYRDQCTDNALAQALSEDFDVCMIDPSIVSKYKSDVELNHCKTLE